MSKPYTRPKSERGKNLDYDKVDWGALQNELDEASGFERKIIWATWARRLKCSKATLYQGLRYNREGKTSWQ